MKQTEMHEQYLAFRRRYMPEDLRLILIAESPPVSGKYFYNPDGRTTEALFTALMRQIGCRPSTKEEGLAAFRSKGWLLVDATYEPVNGDKKNRMRKCVILRDHVHLAADLRELDPFRRVPTVLIKANVCKILEPLLLNDGFPVLNKGPVLYFPSHGRQPYFHRQFPQVLASMNVG